MNSADVIKGLLILDKYREKPGGYNLGAEHDVIYAYPTTNPVDEEVVKELADLGWFQEDVICSSYDGWIADDYDPDAGWAAYV